MGQCAAYGYYQDESDMSVQTEGSVYTAQQESAMVFLVPHHHDLPMRCILDPYHVEEIVFHQAEAMLGQSEYMSRLDREQQIHGEVDDDSEGGYVMSTFAPTEVTSFSVATRLAANFDRYAKAKPKFAKFTKAKPPGTYDISRNRSRQRVMETISENNSFNSIKSATSKNSIQDSLLNKSSKTALGILFGSCICAQQPRLTKFSKEAFYDVLHLKMKLNLAGYYLNHYLTMFPDSITPAGIVRTAAASPGREREAAPRLKSISSDSSSLSSVTSWVGFGSEIPSSPVCLLADGSAFMDLAITGSLGLVDQKSGQGSPAAVSSAKQKNPEHYIVLINQRSSVPLAVCALKALHGPPVVRIYATKQRVVGQKPAASTGDLGLTWTDSYPLFAWAELTTEGEFPMPTSYSIYMASGSGGRFEKEPSYRASHQIIGSPDISIVGRTQTETEYSGCALLSIVSDEQSDEQPFLSLSIARGIDPALLICFAAIVDETMEKTMRLHCELKKKKELRHSRSQDSTCLRMTCTQNKKTDRTRQGNRKHTRES